MAIVDKKGGKLPAYMGDWSATYNDGHGYMVKNRVTIFGSEVESLIDNNTYAPATRDEQTGVVTFDDHWKVISNGSQAYAAALAATNKMAELEEEWDDQDQRMAQMQATINAKQLELGAVQTDEIPTENSGNHMTSGDIYQTLKNSTKGFVDVEPTAGSDNLVKSGGVKNELALGAVYDVSAKNPTAGSNNDGKFESLSALLSDNNLNTLIPTSVRRGGMSIKFIQSSDNKYVQYRLTTTTFSTIVDYWERVDAKIISEQKFSVTAPTSGSSTNFHLDSVLRPGIKYLIKFTGENQNAKQHFLFRNESGTTNIAFYLDGELYNNYAISSPGIKWHTLTVNSPAGYIRVTENNIGAITYVCKTDALDIRVTSLEEITDDLDERLSLNTDKTEILENKVDGFNAFSITAPKRSSEGGDDFELNTAITADYEYNLIVNAETTQQQAGFAPYANGVIPFTLDGIEYSSYARGVSNGMHRLTVSRSALLIRVVDNTNSAIILTGKVDSFDKKIDDVNLRVDSIEDIIENGDFSLINTVEVPQRESYGGTDFPLNISLKAGYPYRLVKTSTNQYGKFNVGFKDSGGLIPFTIDGVTKNEYTFPSNNSQIIVLSRAAQIVRVTDNTTTAVTLQFYSNLDSFGVIDGKAEVSRLKLESLESAGVPLWNYAVANQGLCIDDHLMSINAYRYKATENGFRMADALNNGILTQLVYENTSHDSQIVVKDGVVYIVYAANTVLSDNASSPTSKVILTKFTLSDITTRTDIVVAQNGSNRLTGGAGQPNIVADETDPDLLHILFTANIDGYTIMSCDYSISRGICSNYREVIISNKSGVTGNPRNEDINILFGKNFASDTYYSQQCNSTIAYYNGFYYIGFVISAYEKNKNLAVIFKTSDFTNLIYFADYESFDTLSQCELAIGVDVNGKIYSASRVMTDEHMGSYGANYAIIARWNTNGNLLERRYYRNSGSRPTFFRKGDDLYLICNDWYRSICDIIKVHPYQLLASENIAQFYKGAYHYTSFAMNGTNVICSSSSHNIEVSEFTWQEPLSDAEAYSRMKMLIQGT